MLTEIRDRDAIVSNAKAIASAEVRAAYIVGACGSDAALRRQVEELVAANNHGGGVEPPVAAAAPGSDARRPEVEKAGVNHAETRETPAERTSDMQRSSVNDTVEAKKMGQKKPRGLVTVGALLVLAASVAGAGASLAVLKFKGGSSEELQQAVQERNEARKAAQEAERQSHQAREDLQKTIKLHDEAVATGRTSKNSADDAKEVLAFLQGNLFSAAHRKGWNSEGADKNEGPNKNVTLRQAVDAAAAKIAGAYSDRPLVEASIREILGSTYFDMGEAAPAIKQLEQALALRKAWLGSADGATVDCRNNLAKAYRLNGQHEKASALFEQDSESPAYASSLADQGSILLAQNKAQEAELSLRECLKVRQKAQPGEWTTFDTESLLGAALLKQKKYDAAEKMLLDGYEGMKRLEAKIPSPDRAHLSRAAKRLVDLYTSWDKKDQAAKWRKELQTIVTAKKS